MPVTRGKPEVFHENEPKETLLDAATAFTDDTEPEVPENAEASTDNRNGEPDTDVQGATVAAIASEPSIEPEPEPTAVTTASEEPADSDPSAVPIQPHKADDPSPIRAERLSTTLVSGAPVAL